jgi:Mg2+/Co2+ transporter CorB
MDPYSYIQLNNIQAGTYAAAISTPVLISLFLGMFVLIVLSALFSASETALSAVNMYEIKEIANQKKKTKKKRQANNVIFLLKDFNGTIAGILIANNVVNIINTSLVTVIFTMLLGETGVIYGILLMSVLIITFSEILPKIFAKRYATKLSLRVSSMVKVIYYVTYPINAFFAKIIKSPDYLSISGYRVLSQQINHLNDEGLIDNEKSS